MRYLPTIDLTPQVALMLSRGALRLQPGQWVRDRERYGRYLRTNPRTGVNYFSWIRPTDDWATQAQRFHRACVKGYIGKYQSLYRPAEPVAFRPRPDSGRGPDDVVRNAAT